MILQTEKANVKLRKDISEKDGTITALQSKLVMISRNIPVDFAFYGPSKCENRIKMDKAI